MKNNKHLSLTVYVAFGLIVLSGLVPSFLKLRPNRIENGEGIRMMSSMTNSFYLLLMVILMLFFFFIFMPYRKYRRLNNKVNLVGQLISVILAFHILIYHCVMTSRHLLEGMESAARVSFGIGFWFFLFGLFLLTYEVLLDLKTIWWIRILILILGIASLIIAYKSNALMTLSLFKEFNSKDSRIIDELIRHMELAVSATFTGLALSLYLATKAYRFPKVRAKIMTLVNMAQVIPTLTFLGLLMIPLTALSNTFPFLRQLGISGIGFLPAYIVLSMYTLLPMTTTLLSGYESISDNVRLAAIAMGMTQKQVYYKIELPLVLPYLYTGFRTALIQAVGNTVIAGLVGGGGMGAILFLGLAQSAPDLVVLSALLVVSIAMILKWVLGSFENLFSKY